MTNKLYDSKGQLIGYIRTVEKNQHDDLMKVILSTGHELVFGPCDLTSDRDGNWRIRSGALYPRCVGNKTASATNTAAIKNVKKNPNAGRPGLRVRIVETGEVYSSITDCAKAINGNDRHICDCLAGRQVTHRSYHFEYV